MTKRSFSGLHVISDNGDIAEFITGGYSSTRPNAILDEEPGHLFDDINKFLNSYLTEEQREELFDIYYDISGYFHSAGGLDGQFSKGNSQLNTLLCKSIAKIFEIVSFEDLRDYLVTSPDIRLPPEVTSDYNTDDKITGLYKIRTYLLSDYLDLLAVTLGLRLLLPIWGQYLSIAEKEHGVKWKEYACYQLLYSSKFYCAPAFDRLLRYVETNLQEHLNDVVMMAAVVNNLSVEEIPTYIMGFAMVRKLAIAPITPNIDRDHLMKILFNYIDGKFEHLQEGFDERVVDKSRGRKDTQDDNSSVYNIYKMKESVTIGAMKIYQLYIDGHENVLGRIHPEYDVQKYNKVKEYVDTLDYLPTAEQSAIIGWIIASVVPSVLLDRFDMKSLKSTLIIAQTFLWDKGYPDIAVFLTSEFTDNGIVSTVPRVQMDNDLQRRLEVISPYMLPPTKDERITYNIPTKQLDDLVREIVHRDWLVQGPDALIEDYSPMSRGEYLDFSTRIRDQLAEILILINDLP